MQSGRLDVNCSLNTTTRTHKKLHDPKEEKLELSLKSVNRAFAFAVGSQPKIKWKTALRT